jgi:hypothetical protein
VLSPEHVFGPIVLLVGDLFCEFVCKKRKGRIIHASMIYSEHCTRTGEKKERRKDYDACAFGCLVVEELVSEE